MKRRIYKGMIYHEAPHAAYLKGLNTYDFHFFTVSGFWTAGNREIASYNLCDANGEPLPEYKHIQFSRSRENMFFIESVN